jgi:hypothetical protein
MSKRPKPQLPDLKKGTLIVVKTPPYFSKEYVYEVIGAGKSQVRASLYHSPKVRKSWPVDELAMLFEMKIIRLAEKGDLDKLSTAAADKKKTDAQS